MRLVLIILAALALAAPAAADTITLGPPSSGHHYRCGPNTVHKCPVVTLAVAQTQATPDAFLCYSKFQTDPGSWPVEEAKALLAAGYWAPIAETTTPTATKLATGVYLNCQGFSDGDVIVGGDGTVIDGAGWTAGMPGYYPVGK